MRYLFGDSTESDLEFDYLAFVRDVIDCAVVMVDCEATLAATVERRRSREQLTAAMVEAVDELGKRTTLLVAPVAKDQAAAPVGRCAAAIATAIRDAVERESAQARAALAVERDEMDQQDQRQRARARDVLEKLLRTHDLPGADQELEVAWTTAGVKATMRQRTSFGVEAVLALDLPPSSLFGLDLRVDRIAEGVEVHAFEAGGWLKKSDKLVAHKLGRYHVAGVTVGTDVTVRLRVAADANAAGFVVTARRNGDLTVEPTGGGPIRELAVDDRDRPGLRLLADRLEAAARLLGDSRTGLASVEIDTKPMAEHGHPRVIAERLIAAIAPTVQQIARHSRSPGELVLRRPIGDNRREEIYMPIADLAKRIDGLPASAREVFAPLHLVRAPHDATPLDEPTRPARPAPAVDVAPEPRSAPEPRRAASRTSPPAVPMPSRPAGPIAAVAGVIEAKRASRPSAPPPDAPLVEDKDPAVAPLSPVAQPPSPSSGAEPITATRPAATADKPSGSITERGRVRPDEATLGEAIEAALDEEERNSSPK